jgi:signal transduction histidine kinase
MEICDPLPGLEGDRDKLKQVLLNLLSNAVKYNRPPGSVTVSAYPNGKELKISVADTGIGIPPDEFTHLFQKFFRTRLSEKVASGTGLGLSICKRIVDSHRGRIDVKSKVGEGTTFTITLPLEQS